jgi:regulator of nonsense transcripts 1
VEKIISRLMEAGIKPGQIGVITPYDSQRECIGQILRRPGHGQPEMDVIEIASVDAFQGREKDIIIFSCVRTNNAANVGFLTDEKRLNVALTRARCALYIVGDHRTLRRHKPWDSLIAHYRSKNLLLEGALEGLVPVQQL